MAINTSPEKRSLAVLSDAVSGIGDENPVENSMGYLDNRIIRPICGTSADVVLFGICMVASEAYLKPP